MSHIKWSDIEGFHNLRKTILLKTDFIKGIAPIISFRAKIKLHGTNASVQIRPSGEVFAQSRSKIITVGDDNCGFAAWVEKNKEYFVKFAQPAGPMVIFGEWCGQGIMKQTAINGIGKKVFAVFAIQCGSRDKSLMVVEPENLIATLDMIHSPLPADVFVLPWAENGSVTIDFADTKQTQASCDFINSLVEQVEHQDPWVKEIFGVEGIGEGLVFYPQYKERVVPRGDITDFLFKAKGEKHKVVKTKKAVQIDPTAVASVAEFIELVLTESRLEQAVTETCAGQFYLPWMGNFLQWIGRDIKKECQLELQAAKLEWKVINKEVMKAAKEWYIKKTKEF